MDMIYVNSLWIIMKNAFQKILLNDREDLCYEDLYRNAYAMVLHNYGGKLYEGVLDIITEHLISKVLGEVLYAGEFLTTFEKAWTDHQSVMVLIKDILVYLDRVYVRPNHLPSVYNLGLTLFKECILDHTIIQERLHQSLMDTIALEKQGQVVDRSPLKNICKLMMALELDNKLVYEENCEEAFLTKSLKLFQRENEKRLKKRVSNSSVEEKSRIIEQTERAKSSPEKPREVPFVDLMEKDFIYKHMEEIVTMKNFGNTNSLQKDKTEELASMYTLFSRTQAGLETMCECLSKILKEQGTLLMTKKIKRTNPVTIIQALLDQKSRLDYFLLKSFNNDKELKQTVERDFEFLLSLNPRTPEYLSLFIDNQLRREFSGLPEKEVESCLVKFAALFKLTRDKVAFKRHYRQHFANRLLLNQRFSEEYEKDVASKILEGSDLASSLEEMFEDIRDSVYTMEEFNQAPLSELSFKEVVEFKVQILTNGNWPVILDLKKYIIPFTLSYIFDTFKIFYRSKYHNRRLMLQPLLGTADVSASFQSFDDKQDSSQGDAVASNGTRTYTLQVSTLQMIVLLLFNERERWTFEEIEQKVTFTRAQLVSALQSLANRKQMHNVLCKEPQSKEIQENHVFVVNDQFRSKRDRVTFFNARALPMLP